MVDPETVRRRLREIDRRLAELRQIAARGRGHFLEDKGFQAQAERHLQLAIQSCIDVAIHILAEDSPITPEDYGSAFIALAGMTTISQETAEQMRSAAGLRNILVHAYLEVDPKRVWEHIGRLEVFEKFASDIDHYLGTDHPR